MARKSPPDAKPEDTPQPRRIGYVSDTLPTQRPDAPQTETDRDVVFTDWASI
ncbi:hypothetical protein [Pseudogemmobacter sp. W21_MBD1_M6]|uniref:hypothetical protein n=1 Tax=Pseudogemmobacter sp. W21_MBD1_M6 TaxID=3240271 RepID=UPI003F9A93FD